MHKQNTWGSTFRECRKPSEQDVSAWAVSVWAVSVWAVFVWAVSVWVVSVWPFRSGLFDHGTLRSDYEILQKSDINAKWSRLIQSALPASSCCRLPIKVEGFHSKRAPFTIPNSGKRCRQGIVLGIKFVVVVQSNWISSVSGLAWVFDYDLQYCKMQA